MAALVDLAGTVGTAATLATSLADLRREEHERAALYAVALQLTGRAELREILDTITNHARELLGAERAVACLADPRIDGHSYDWTNRLAVADDGSTCLLAHPDTHGEIGRHNPACPMQHDGPRTGGPGAAHCAAPTASSASCASCARAASRSPTASASSSARWPTWPPSPCGLPASARRSSSSRSSRSGTGSPASSTTASPRSSA